MTAKTMAGQASREAIDDGGREFLFDDGGPAFAMPTGPEPRVNATTHFNEGMSLRDYFAASVAPAFIANAVRVDVRTAAYPEVREAFEAASAASYHFADELLKARKGGGE